MSRLPRFWKARPYGDGYPLVPSRAVHWMLFISSGFLTFGSFAYLLWAKSRGLVDWFGIWSLWPNFIAGGAISLVLGGIQRRRWLRKRAQRRTCEASELTEEERRVIKAAAARGMRRSFLERLARSN